MAFKLITAVGLFLYISSLAYTQTNSYLNSMARKAKQEGKTQLTIFMSTAGALQPYVPTFEDAKNSFSLAIVKIEGHKSFVQNAENIYTIHKLKVINLLSRRPATPTSVSLDDFHIDDVPPLSADEIWLLQAGGTATIEGVTIDQKAVELPNLEAGKRFLVFLDISSAGKLATAPLLQNGWFEVMPNGTLRSFGNPRHAVVDNVNTLPHKTLSDFVQNNNFKLHPISKGDLR